MSNSSSKASLLPSPLLPQIELSGLEGNSEELKGQGLRYQKPGVLEEKTPLLFQESNEGKGNKGAGHSPDSFRRGIHIPIG